MVYVSSLLACADETAFMEATRQMDADVGIEVFSFRYDEAEIPALRAMINACEHREMTFHGPMRSLEMTLPAEDAVWMAQMDTLHRAFALCQEVGAASMVLHTHERPVLEDRRHAMQEALRENLWRLIPIAASYGITLHLENVEMQQKGIPLFSQAEYMALFDEIPEIKALIDIGHVHVAHWSLEVLLHTLGERIGGFHLHNNDGLEDMHAWLAAGNMDIIGNLGEMHSAAPGATAILEYGAMDGKPVAQLLEDVALVKARFTT